MLSISEDSGSSGKDQSASTMIDKVQGFDAVVNDGVPKESVRYLCADRTGSAKTAVIFGLVSTLSPISTTLLLMPKAFIPFSTIDQLIF